MRLLRRRAAKRRDAAPRELTWQQRLASGLLAVRDVVRLVPPPKHAPDVTPTLTRDAIRRRRKAKRAAKAAEPPKPQETPRRKLIGGGSSDTGKPSKSESQKQAERDAAFRRVHGRPPRVLIRTADGPTVAYHDPDAPPPDPDVQYEFFPSTGYR